MNTGQSILTIGAMLLLSILVLRMNSNFIYSSDIVSTSKLGVTAISLAESHLEEIKSKAFDEASVSTAIYDDANFTIPSKLGKDNSEVYPNFDDVDDYNGVTYNSKWIVDTVQIDPNIPKTTKGNYELFTWTCSVIYIDPAYPNKTSATQTFTKKVTIYITNSVLADTLKISTIIGYWSFR